MLPLVRLALTILRAGSHGLLFCEAQRLALRVLRPTSPAHVAAAEEVLLSAVAAPVERRYVPAPTLPMHTLSAGDPDGPPIVLLHGHSMSAAFFFRNFDDLISLGYRVHAVDLLGWGRSARPTFSGTTPDDTLDFFLSSLAAWVKEMGLPESFALLGHSLGAYIAFEYAKRNTDRVSRLVLISPAAIARPLPLSRAIYFNLPPQAIIRRGGLLGFLFYMLKYPRTPCYTRDSLREYTYQLAAQLPPSGEKAVAPIIAFNGLRASIRTRMATCTRPLVEGLDHLLRVPVLLVCGETDSSINVNDVHMLEREMRRKGYKVRLAVVEGTDHCPHIEEPGAFFDAVFDFLHPGDKRGKKAWLHPSVPTASSSPTLDLARALAGSPGL
jgi:pimeloyl-ACP methyl ester carboxylesterase